MVGWFFIVLVASRVEKKGRLKYAPLEKIWRTKKKSPSKGVDLFKKIVVLNGRTSSNTITI